MNQYEMGWKKVKNFSRRGGAYLFGFGRRYVGANQINVYFVGAAVIGASICKHTSWKLLQEEHVLDSWKLALRKNVSIII